MRRDDSPRRYRRGTAPRAVKRTTVASVVHGALTDQPTQAPAAYRETAPVRTAAPQPLPETPAVDVPFDDARTRVIDFGDLPAEDPALFAPVAVAESPLRAGHEHADSVLAEMRAETAALKPRGEHMTHHQQPKAWLRVVPLVDPVAELCDSVELALVRFAIAAFDLVLKPGGAHALAMLDAPYADRPVSTYDRRPLGATVGRELSEVAA